MLWRTWQRSLRLWLCLRRRAFSSARSSFFWRRTAFSYSSLCADAFMSSMRARKDAKTSLLLESVSWNCSNFCE